MEIALGRSGRSIPLLWAIVGLVLPVKVLLAYLLPMTADEAYFVLWGETPALGYSEHPPMIGLIEYLLLFIGRYPLIVRLPAVLGTLSIGLGLFWVLRDIDREKAVLAAVLFMISPLNLIYVIVTTDTALIFFAFWSAALLFKATRGGRYRDYAAAGALLGLAFLSKYFAVLLALAYVVSYLLSAKDRKKTVGLIVLFACVVPFGLISLYWNYTHSWMEVRYPFNRDDVSELSLVRPLVFLAMQLYLLIPAGLFYLIRRIRELPGSVARSPVRLYGLLFLVPIVVLTLLSLKASVGFHWLLSFYPLLYPVVGWVLGGIELRKSIRISAWFTGVQVVALAIVLVVPVSWTTRLDEYATIVMGMRPEKIAVALEPYSEGHRFATPSYGVSALMSYHNPGKRFAVFGVGSAHGRNDDLVTDFRDWDGDDVVIFQHGEPDPGKFEPYFDSVSIETVEAEGAIFHVVVGTRFSYEAYRDEVLAGIRDRYYQIPGWLPLGRCHFRAKYFPEG